MSWPSRILVVADVSGAFVFLGVLLAFACLVLLAEILYAKYANKDEFQVKNAVAPFSIHLDVPESVSPDGRMQIYVKYMEILDIMKQEIALE